MSEPVFRFHPTALTSGRSFKPSEAACDACGRLQGWLYSKTLYAGQDVKSCAECIASGRLDAFMDDDFWSFFDIDLSEIAAEYQDELLKRTPGFAVFNPFTWPGKDGVPLAFLGYGEDEALWRDPSARAAMNEAFGQELKTPSPYALVFRELGDGAFRVVLDLD